MIPPTGYSKSLNYPTNSLPTLHTTPVHNTTGTLEFYATPPLSPPAYRTSVFDPPRGEQVTKRYIGMDEDDHQRRQSDQSSYTSSRDYGQVVRGIPRENVSSRFRQSQLSSIPSPSPTFVPRTSAGSTHHGLVGYGYASGQPQYGTQLQNSNFNYQPDFAQDTQRQQLTPYSQNMMFNLQHQANPQSSYDPVSQYNPRQSAAVEVLSTQFGVPQYYNSGESTSTSGPASIPQPYTSTQYQHYQQPAPIGRATLTSSYPVTMTDYSEAAGQGVIDQPLSSQDASFTDEYNAYSQTLKQTFSDTQSGRLVEAGSSLLDISRFLLGHAVELGLEKNAPDLHSERIKLWNEFNTCWLAVLQKQKDMTEEMLRTGQTVHVPQSILQEDFLNKMGNEIIQLCDGLERHGLVDYQMGVWEEEIISALEDCLDLLEGDDETLLTATPSGRNPPPSLGSSTR